MMFMVVFSSEAFHTRLRVAGDDSIGAGNHESIGAANDGSKLEMGCLEERAHCAAVVQHGSMCRLRLFLPVVGMASVEC